jgi:hypothetical protein
MTSTSTPGKPKAIQTAKLETPAAYLTPKIQERQIKKRKAAANSSPNEEAAKIGNPNKRVIDRLCMQISKLGRIVGETYHPKKELKSVAESLASLTAQLQSGNSNEDSSSKEIARLIEKVNAEVQVDVEDENSKDAEGLREKLRTAEQDLRALREENDVLRKSLQEKRPTQDAAVQVDLKSELRTCETQTGAWSNSTNELKTLEKTDTFEQWGATASKKWREDLFTNTVIVVGTPFERKDDITKVVLVELEDGIWSIQRAFRERYPELRFVEHELDVVDQTTRVMSQLPGEVVRRKVVRILHDGTKGDIWNKLCELRVETESDVRVAMHHVNCMRVERLRKMVEAIFHGTGRTVCIYTTQAQMEEGRKEIPPEGRIKDAAKVLKESRGRTKGALIIKAKNEQSAKEVLQLMRTNINLQEIGVSVKGLARSDSGKIKIDVQETKEVGRMCLRERPRVALKTKLR